MRAFLKARWAIGLAILCATSTASARMYQWVSPATGSTQLSGEPPSWYRSGNDGPRVLVFENGYLVDDTHIRVSPSRSRALRSAAFDELNRRRTLEAVERIAQGQARKKDKQLAAEQESSLIARTVADVDAANALPDELDAAAIARLKSIIAEFDKSTGQ